MELSLTNQLIEAFELEYFQALMNSTTNMINNDILIITTFLQSIYSHITDIKMINMEHNLTSTVYDTSKPVNSVFNKITKHADLCDLNDIPINEKRQVQCAYVIFQKSRAYLDSLKKWNACQKINNMYNKMKIIMREERQSFETVGTLTVEDSLNQVQMIQSIQEHQTQMSTQIEEKMKINLIKVLTTYGKMEQDMYD